MQKTVFTGYLHDFNVDYEVISVDNIDKYLMEKNNIV